MIVMIKHMTLLLLLLWTTGITCILFLSFVFYLQFFFSRIIFAFPPEANAIRDIPTTCCELDWNRFPFA